MTLSISRKPKSLSEQAYDTIKDMIVSGKLPQGEVISISAMAEGLNISRTPVTNACQLLEADKFLKIVPKQGVIINTITLEDIRETYELRAAIESYSAKRAFENITKEDIEHLKSCLERQKEFIDSNDIHGFMKEDMIFHKYILNKYHNTQFFTLLDNLFDRAYMIGIKANENNERFKSTLEEHRKIVETLESGSREQFSNAIEHNILSGYVSLTGGYSI